jgi:hypothetical protein
MRVRVGCGMLVVRSVFAIGICALAGGLCIPASSRSAELVADQPTPPDLAAAGSSVAGNPEVDHSYFLTPFKLADQPNLKQSVFGFAGRTNSGNLGNTFAFGAGAPQTRFYDNYIVGGAYQRDFFQFNSGILIGAEVGLADRFGNYTICCDTTLCLD